MPPEITDPIEQERIMRSFLARRATAKRSQRRSWTEVFTYAEPLSYFSLILLLLGLELFLKAHGHATGISTYFYFILFGAVWIFRIECRLIAQSKTLDAIHVALTAAEKQPPVAPVAQL